jgi:hypothetical protein
MRRSRNKKWQAEFAVDAQSTQRFFISIIASLIPRGLLRKELFPDLLEFVIPECFYRWFDGAHHRRDRSCTPD